MPVLNFSATSVKLDEAPTIMNFQIGEQDFNSLTVTLSQQIYDFDKSWAGFRAAEHSLQAARYSKERLEKQIIFMATQGYFNLLTAIDMEVVAKEAVTRSEAYLQQTRDFFAQGLVDKSDVLRASLRLANDKNEQIKARNAVELAESSLARTIGAGIHTSLHPVKIPAPTSLPLLRLETCIADAFEYRADLKQKEEQVRAAEEAYREARAAFAPSISAFASSEHSDDSYAPNPNTWKAGIQLDFTPVAGGANYAGMMAARKELEAAKVSLMDFHDSLMLEVKERYLTWGEARDLLDLTKTMVREAEENMRITRDKYNQQLATATDVLDAHTELTSSKAQRTAAIYGLYSSAAALELAIGTRLRKEGEIRIGEDQND